MLRGGDTTLRRHNATGTYLYGLGTNCNNVVTLCKTPSSPRGDLVDFRLWGVAVEASPSTGTRVRPVARRGSPVAGRPPLLPAAQPLRSVRVHWLRRNLRLLKVTPPKLGWPFLSTSTWLNELVKWFLLSRPTCPSKCSRCFQRFAPLYSGTWSGFRVRQYCWHFIRERCVRLNASSPNCWALRCLEIYAIVIL